MPFLSPRYMGTWQALICTWQQAILKADCRCWILELCCWQENKASIILLMKNTNPSEMKRFAQEPKCSFFLEPIAEFKLIKSQAQVRKHKKRKCGFQFLVNSYIIILGFLSLVLYNLIHYWENKMNSITIFSSILYICLDVLSNAVHTDLWMSDSTVWCTDSFATKFKFVNRTLLFCILRVCKSYHYKKKYWATM